MNPEPNPAEDQLQARGRRLAQALRTIVEDYPSADPDVTPTLRLTLSRRGRELDHIELPAADVAHLAALLGRELDTWRNAHPGGTGTCGHCDGTGAARPTGQEG
jgi:hypothetical protein